MFLPLFIGGCILFLILYGVASMFAELGETALAGCLIPVAGSSVILLIYYLLVRAFESRKVKELNLREAPANIIGGFASSLLVFALYAIILRIFGMYRIGSVSFDGTALLEKFCFCLLVAVGEEVLCRGIMFRLVAQCSNITVALLVSSLIFGFMHIPNPNATLWSGIAIAVEAGLLLGAAYAFSGSLWMPIGLHWMWNFTEGNLLGTPVSGMDFGPSVITPDISGPELLTGGAFGPENSVITVVLGILLSVWFLCQYISNRKCSRL